MALTTVEVPRLDPHTFTGPVRTLSGIARIKPVTPDVAYGEFMRWLYIEVDGTISIVQWDGTTVQLPGLIPKIWHPIYSIQINSSGTTATGIFCAS